MPGNLDSTLTRTILNRADAGIWNLPLPEMPSGIPGCTFGRTSPVLRGAKRPTAQTPREVFELAIKILQIAQQTSNYKLVTENLLPWLVQRWIFVFENQRFQLIRPSFHEIGIRAALEQDGVSVETKVAEIMAAILPTLGISNQRELSQALSSLPR